MLPIVTCTIESPDDHDIILEYFQKNKLRLYAEARKYFSTQEDVEDVVYESLVRIMDHMEKFRSLLPHERLQYGRAIIRNLSYTCLKRRSHFTIEPFEDVDMYLAIEESQLPDNIVFQRIQLEKIRAIWAEIPVEERMLLEQKYILDWSDRDLAVTLGIKPQSVRMRLTRAKRTIIQLLKEQGFQISDWL